MKKLFYFSAFSAILVLASCTHEEEDTLAPVITITEPLNMNMYNNGDTIFIRGTVTENDDLHELYIGLHTPTDTLFSAAPEVHGLPSYTIDTLWVVSGISANTNAVLQFIAADHHENVDTTNLNLHLMP